MPPPLCFRKIDKAIFYLFTKLYALLFILGLYINTVSTLNAQPFIYDINCGTDGMPDDGFISTKSFCDLGDDCMKYVKVNVVFIQDGNEGIELIQSELIIREDDSFMGVAIIKNENNVNEPLLMNFSSRGDTLWTKRITFDPHSDIYIRDIEPIEGGYVLAGFKHFPLPQHGWLVTIDEEGNFCEELGCVEAVVDIENTETQGHRGFLLISPNPVRGQATIQYQIPKEGVLKVYDYQGKLIDNRILDIGYSSLMLEVEDWSSGVYLYQLEIEGESIKSGKLIVE